MATWDQVRQNPTLYPHALLPGEGERLHWHEHANQPHSSQVFCVSAFGTLRTLSTRDVIIRQLMGLPDARGDKNAAWTIELETERPGLLSEYGTAQATSVDVLLGTREAVFSIEAKLLRDAASGFGGCGQPKNYQCAGFYGPGSDLKTRTNAWCRLEVWDGDRSPRTYWTLGKAFFQESVYRKQASGEACPLGGSNYQLMRNFLFAAALAQQQHAPSFGVVVMAPKATAAKLEQQIDAFRTTILQPQFGAFVQLVYYERLIELLQQSKDAAALALANFLSDRISALIS